MPTLHISTCRAQAGDTLTALTAESLNAVAQKVARRIAFVRDRVPIDILVIRSMALMGPMAGLVIGAVILTVGGLRAAGTTGTKAQLQINISEG